MGESTLSGLAADARRGDAAATAALIDTVYPELRRLAHHYLAGERREHTLQTNDLVHDAWVRLFASADISIHDRSHLVALMAAQMRRALVDYARHRNTAKGPGAAIRVSMGPAHEVGVWPDEDVLALDEALQPWKPSTPAPYASSRCGFSAGWPRRKPLRCSACRWRRSSATGRSPARGSRID